MFSQNGEDKIILDLIKGKDLFYVELGAGDGTHFSNCKLLRQNGWLGISIDSDNKGNKNVIQEFINQENVLDLVPNVNIDFLSIDIDGNDYWILKKILANRNIKCVCCEVNSQLPKDQAIAINYDANRIWDGSYAYGMSYKAAFDLLKSFGYAVIHNVNNTNLIAIKEVTLNECYETWSHPENLPEGSYWQEIIKK